MGQQAYETINRWLIVVPCSQAKALALPPLQPPPVAIWLDIRPMCSVNFSWMLLHLRCPAMLQAAADAEQSQTSAQGCSSHAGIPRQARLPGC